MQLRGIPWHSNSKVFNREDIVYGPVPQTATWPTDNGHGRAANQSRPPLDHHSHVRPFAYAYVNLGSERFTSLDCAPLPTTIAVQHGTRKLLHRRGRATILSLSIDPFSLAAVIFFLAGCLDGSLWILPCLASSSSILYQTVGCARSTRFAAPSRASATPSSSSSLLHQHVDRCTQFGATAILGPSLWN